MECQFWNCFSSLMAIYCFQSMPSASTKCVTLEWQSQGGMSKLGHTSLWTETVNVFIRSPSPVSRKTSWSRGINFPTNKYPPPLLTRNYIPLPPICLLFPLFPFINHAYFPSQKKLKHISNIHTLMVMVKTESDRVFLHDCTENAF